MVGIQNFYSVYLSEINKIYSKLLEQSMLIFYSQDVHLLFILGLEALKKALTKESLKVIVV